MLQLANNELGCELRVTSPTNHKLPTIVSGPLQLTLFIQFFNKDIKVYRAP